jgi:hypothetical protein
VRHSINVFQGNLREADGPSELGAVGAACECDESIIKRTKVSSCNLPQVSSPFTISRLVVGANEMPISCAVIVPRENRLSVTVGIEVPVAGERVPATTNFRNMLWVKIFDITTHQE